MPLEAEQLITFAVVAELGSLSAAAQASGRTQPAVSAQMKRLAAEVGEPLYRRSSRGVELTEVGEALLPHAQALLRSLEGARAWTRSRRAGQQGMLKIAASMTAAVYVLPGVLADFHRGHPQLELQLLTRNSLDAMALLRRAQAHIALIEGPVPALPSDFEARELLRDEIVLVVRPDHPLAGRGRVLPEDLRGLAMVQREPGSGTREVVELALKGAGASVTDSAVIMTATGIEAVKEAVLHGLAAGFISNLAIAREVEAGMLEALPVVAPGFERSMTLIHPRRELCAQATRLLIDHLLASRH